MTNLETVRLFLVASPDHAAAARRLGRRLQRETHLRGQYAKDVADCLVYHQAHPEALDGFEAELRAELGPQNLMYSRVVSLVPH